MSSSIMIAEEYTSSLSDLTVNSKPLINMLTMLAEENREHAPAIVQAVEKHLQKVPSDIKLPVLYLIDSIVKNVGHSYIDLFTQNIVSTFCTCFEKVDERTRAQMFKLRQTWNEVFPAKKLYAVDLRVQSIDPAWPITAAPPTSIHVNPKFFAKQPTHTPEPATTVAVPATQMAMPPISTLSLSIPESRFVGEIQMRDQLLRKQKELIELQQKKLTLESMQLTARYEEQQRKLQIVQAQQQFFQNRPALVAPSSNIEVIELVEPKAKPTPTSIKTTSITKLHSQQLPPYSIVPGTSATNVTISPQNNARTVPAPPSPVKPVARVRDPRLAARVLSVTVAQDKSQFDRLFEEVQLVEPAKPKLHITNNLGCDNKNNVPNKERRGITKPIMSTKARNTKLSPPNIDAYKGQESSKSNVLQPSSSLSPSLKKIARLRESPKVKFIDQLPPIPKLDENRKDQDISTKKISPSKTLSPRKKAQVEKDKSPKSKNNDKESKLMNKSDSPRRRAVDKKASENLNFARATGNVRDRSKERSKFDMDMDGSPSPPPPPTISESKSQEGDKFRVKPSLKGRNYMRKNRGSESRSRSPIKSDVDLRLSGPPEKMQKLSLPEDTTKKPLVDATINVDATKDVDLRQLPGKRASSERESGDQPPVKKSRAELIDVLFGNEDVDLRTLATSTLPLQPSPPPPPIISQLSPTSSNSDSCTSKSDAKKVHSKASSSDEHMAGNGDVHPRDWSKFKGPKSPLVSSPYRTRRGIKPPPGQLDRLGRPFLFQRSQDGHKESRRSVLASEDTDMRRRSRESYNAGDNNMHVMLAQAEEQRKNGTITSRDYNKLIYSMFKQDEVTQLQEAKRRDENWKPRRQRLDLSPVSDDGSLAEPAAEFSPCSDTSDGNRHSPPPAQSADLDERFPRAPRHMLHKPRAPRHNNWAWGPKPQQWMPRPMRPMQQPPPFIRHPLPVNEGAFSWRPPHQPFMPQMQGPPSFPGEPRFFGPRPEHFDSHPRPVDDQFVPHGSDYDPHMEHHIHPELPLADPIVLEHISNDTMRTINIDGQPREIRFYGETALTIDLAGAREVIFQRGTRRVLFDDRDSFVCAFNDTYRDFIIDGNPHKIRFGAPTRELYIDGKWYECYFGGPPINIEIDGKMKTVKLEGPPPQVKLGFKTRPDLCAGKVTIIINAIHMVPIYLDAKPQRFDIENKPHILRFVNALMTVLINGQPFDVEFGGLPKPIIVRNKKHFIRFGPLPKGVRPGHISIRNMEGGRLPSPTHDDQVDDDLINDQSLALHQVHSSDYPTFTSGNQARQPQIALNEAISAEDLPCEEDDEPVMPVTGVYVNNKISGGSVSEPLDVLTSLLPTPSSGFGYQVEPESASQDGSGFSKSQESTASVATDPSTANSSFNQFLPASVEPLTVAELFQKLVATGMVPLEKSNEVGAPVDTKKDEEIGILKHVDFKAMDTLRSRQPGMVAILYSGIQCSSCGVRFPPEETVKYSQHLDWHFRQNRRDRDNVRKAQSRKWYYEVSDWLLYEEIEDLEHRTPSLFEPMPEASIGEDNEPIVIPSVPVGENSENPFCEMCHDKFEQFYNEESEEWHLKLAIRVDGKIYHPLCYDDFRVSTLMETSTEMREEAKEEEQSVTNEEQVLSEEVSVKEEVIEEEEIMFVPMEIKKESSDSEDIIETGRVDASVPTGPTEDLTKQEDMEEENCSEGELIVAAILDDILESAELQLFGPRPVKLEPVDDAAVDANAEQVKLEELAPLADTTHAAVVSSIDGNVQFEDKLQTAAAGSKIKINITKPIPVREAHPETDPETSSVDNDTERRLSPLMRTASDEDSEPPPPGVETLPEPAKLKPKLVGRQFTILPPVNKGSDLSGLCSIM